jgi:L-lactate dehydrogenase complex protein LldE
MRIALFVTCLADTLFPDVGKSTTALLERLGPTRSSRRPG